jgi:hypothetical protein
LTENSIVKSISMVSVILQLQLVNADCPWRAERTRQMGSPWYYLHLITYILLPFGVFNLSTVWTND